MTDPLGQAPADGTSEWAHASVALTVAGTDMRLDEVHREGAGTPLVLLHGFGSTKEEYADMCHRPEFAGQPILAYDAPGCGRSWIADPAVMTVELFVASLEGNLAPEDCFLSRQIHDYPADDPESFMDACEERARESAVPPASSSMGSRTRS